MKRFTNLFAERLLPLLFSLSLLVFFTATSFAQPCDGLIAVNSATLEHEAEGFLEGCSTVKYCMTLQNVAEETTLHDVTITFVSSTLNSPTDFSIPVDLDGFVEPDPINDPGVFVRTVDFEPYQEKTFCLYLRFDEAFSGSIHKQITADVGITVGSPSCNPPLTFEFDAITPSKEIVAIGTNIGATNLSDVAIATQADHPGLLWTPALSMNNDDEVLIRGTLIVDEDITFYFPDSRLHMDEGAKIIVEDGSQLHFPGGGLNDGRIVGCADMWDGIIVEDGGELSITDNYVVRDGIRAVVAEGGSTVTVTECIFENNFRSIFTPQGDGMNDVTFTISDNTFSAPSLKSPYTGVQGWCGIEVNNLKKNLILKRNQFKNLQDGLVGNGSNIFINYDTYEDIEDAGIDVAGADQILMQLGNGTPANPNFNRCHTGIRAKNMTVYSDLNVMREVTDGYFLDGGIIYQTYLILNDIKASRFGIGIRNWRLLSGMSVESNVIEMNGQADNVAGISAQLLSGENNPLLPKLPTCFIKDNEITLKQARYGIHLNASAHTSSEDNEVYLQNNRKYDGISIDGGFRHYLRCNYVDGTSNFDVEQTGFTVKQASNIRLFCNTPDDTKIGVHVAGTSNPIVYKGTQFYDHFHALQIGDLNGVIGGYTGIQNHSGNRWHGTYAEPKYGAVHNGNDFDVINSKLVVTTSPGNPITTEDVPYSEETFFAAPVPGTTYNCPVAPSCPTMPLITNEISTTDLEIIRGNLTPGYFTETQVWTGERQLYRRLLETPSLVETGTAADTFFTTNATTTVGKFELMYRAIARLFVLDSATQVQVVANREGVRANLGELQSIEEQLDDNPTPAEEASLLAQKASVLQENVALDSIYKGIRQTLHSSRIAAASQALNYNAAISVTEDFEVNQKEFNRVYLETIIDDQDVPDSAQTATLRDIAIQCPYAGGDAVFQARAFLGDDVVYDDSTACQSNPQPLVKPGKAEIEQIEFSIHPNPSTGLAILELEKEAKEDGEILLQNTLGHQVYRQKFRTGEQAFLIDLSDLPVGTYFLKVRTASTSASQLILHLK